MTRSTIGAMLISTSLGALSSIPAVAQANLPIAGLGRTNCSEFIAKPEEQNAYFAWAQGYLTGINSAIGLTGTIQKNLFGLSLKDQQTMIRKYCEKHPADIFEGALLGLYAALPEMERTQ